MIAAASSPREYSAHIRRLDIYRDLDAVADLIEDSFPIQEDADGMAYITQMRKSAREMRYLKPLSGLVDLGSNELPKGLVWVEGGRIVGNLTLIPFKQGSETIHLIANVAVEKNFRRKGIAHALTQRALTDLRRKREREVWLQVRVDNAGAQALYRAVGFTDQFVRTTWRIRPKVMSKISVKLDPSLQVIGRRAEDWRAQKKWLADAYPAQMRWNLPVDFPRFEPGALQTLSNFIHDVRLRHWSVTRAGELQGVASWQRTTTYADNLWLAPDPTKEADALPVLLRHVLRHRPPSHPLSIDYPVDRHPDIFQRMGFKNFRTLIWMRCSLS
ncbi:GNAT family N-acetyltransferase [bacterium]|nr:GNAT family N-acetyltransferase [bacterium]